MSAVAPICCPPSLEEVRFSSSLKATLRDLHRRRALRHALTEFATRFRTSDRFGGSQQEDGTPLERRLRLTFSREGSANDDSHSRAKEVHLVVESPRTGRRFPRKQPRSGQSVHDERGLRRVVCVPYVRFTYAGSGRVTDGARTRDLRSHNPPTPVSKRCCMLQNRLITAKSRVWQQPATTG